MMFVQPGLCVLVLAAGCGWAAWLVAGHRAEDIAAAGLGVAIAASFVAYMATDRKEDALWLRFGLYGGALAVACASLWTGMARPLVHVPSFGVAGAWLRSLDGMQLVMFAVPLPAAGLLGMLWVEVAVAGFKYLRGSERRRRAESDLHGHAQLLGRRFLKRLARRRGILLGQWGAWPGAPLIGWSLEGSAITVAPPRTGKGALIALNLLSPDDRGFDGSTVTIDPRGELWCIAARRRRELGRRVLLMDPFGVVEGAPGRVSRMPPAGREDRDLQPARVHPRRRRPRRARHQRAARRPAHTAPSRRSRQRSPLLRVGPRDRGRLHGLVALQGAGGEADAGDAARDAVGLVRGPPGRSRGPSRRKSPSPAVSRTSRSSARRRWAAEEGGSNFSTIANQLAFLNYPEMVANTAASELRSTGARRRRDRPVRGGAGRNRRAHQGMAAALGRHSQRRCRHQYRSSATC